MNRPQLFGKTLFVDIMMSMVILMTALMMVSTVEEPKTASGADGLKTDGVYAIAVEWPSDKNDDVDLYVRDPDGNIVYFSARDLGLMHLEHDDQGALSDSVTSKGATIAVAKNEERVVIRGGIEGEYVVNVHMYNKRSDAPVPVTIRLYRLKGGVAEIMQKERYLDRNGDEHTAFRFTLDRKENVIDTNELPRLLTGKGVR